MILVLCAAGACGDDGGPPIDAGIGEVELGTGVDAFEPLVSDQLELFAGPQGGHHFIVHARIAGFLPGDPTMPGSVDNPATTFAAFSADVQIDLRLPPYRLGYVEQSDGTFDLGAGRILQVDEAVVPDLYGAQVTLTVQVVDPAGTHGEDRVTGTVVEGPPPG